MRTIAVLLMAATLAAADGWDPIAGPGIDLPSNTGLTALRQFGTHLYIGTENSALGCRIYRTADGATFTPVLVGGFGDGMTKVTEFEEFGGFLYAATAGPVGGRIYRSSDGLIWTAASPIGLGSAFNVEITALENFSGNLYAGTRSTGGDGADLWRSPDGTTWTTSITTSGFGDVDNTAINDLEDSGGNVYAVTSNSADGGQLYRISSGGGFTDLVDDGFGNSDNRALTALEVYNGQLFIGTHNTVDGFEIWSTPNDVDFFLRAFHGLGDDANAIVTDLENIGSPMYVGTESQYGEAFEAFQTFGGGGYEDDDDDGFGDPGNFRLNDYTAFGNKIWAGTSNPAGGGLYNNSLSSGSGSGTTYYNDDDDDDHHGTLHCVVATAAFGSPSVPRVAELRRLRDEQIEAAGDGRRFTDLYRQVGPPAAAVVDRSEVLRALVRKALLK